MSLARALEDGAITLFEHPEQVHFFGDRFFRGDGLEQGGQAITLTQVHGDKIVSLQKQTDVLATRDLQADGLVTNLKSCFIAVKTADCVPVILFDPKRKVVAALHAGWRGTVLNIAAKGLSKMVADFGSDPQDILAGIGPSIAPCCFEVKEDVVNAIESQTRFKEAVIQKVGAKNWSCDLPKLNRLQLEDAGVSPKKISLSGLCTFCLPERYFSFRRDKKKLGNMLSAIMLR